MTKEETLDEMTPTQKYLKDQLDLLNPNELKEAIIEVLISDFQNSFLIAATSFPPADKTKIMLDIIPRVLEVLKKDYEISAERYYGKALQCGN